MLTLTMYPMLYSEADLLVETVSRVLRPILRLVPKRGMASCYHGIL